MAEQQELPQHVQFAALIAELVDKEQYDYSTILNGLAIAAASFLVDYTVDLDGNVDQRGLNEAHVRFAHTLRSAEEFAVEQVKKIVAAKQSSH